MWVLIECDDPATDPGHNEKRRILLDESETTVFSNHHTDCIGKLTVAGFGSEMHPCTPGDEGYHCPICHKDIPPATTGKKKKTSDYTACGTERI